MLTSIARIMLVSRLLLFFALIDINYGGGKNRRQSTNNTSATNTTFWSKFMFADVPDFDVEFTYEEVYSADGIANQLLQNFFNWFCPTVFWFSFLPFYERLKPIFDPSNNQRLFGDVPIFNVTTIYQTTFSPEGVLIQMVQNFWNFFISTMFWLTYIPVYERLFPIFNADASDNSQPGQVGVGEGMMEEAGTARLADSAQFNTTFIYYGVYSPTGVAIQLIQNFFNWFSTTMFWLSYTPFYERMLPIFLPDNNQRSLESVFNPAPYFKYLLYTDAGKEGEIVQSSNKPKTRVKSSFKLIEHLKEFFYGEEVLELGEERIFGDPWSFNITTVYQTTFSPDGIMIQMVQNFFNFFAGTMFWLSYLPFYERLFPIFDEERNNMTEANKFTHKFSMDVYEKQFAATPRDFKPSGKRYEVSFGKFSKLLSAFADFFEGIQGLFTWTKGEEDSEIENYSERPRLFGDVLAYNVTDIYESTLSADGIMQLQIQNFFNFFTSTMFWLSFIPLYERLFAVFDENNYQDKINSFGFADVPDFNVTSIYEETYLSDTIAIQLLQNFFNWFTATVVWFPFMVLYDRIHPIFLPENNQRSLEESQACDETLYVLAEKLVSLLRLFAGISNTVQRIIDYF